MSMSWRKPLQNHREAAIDLVRRNVAAFRSIGEKTPTALQLQAPMLEITERRARLLFHRDGEPMVNDDDLNRMLVGTIRLHRWLAGKLRDKASQFDRVADEMEAAKRHQGNNRGNTCKSQPVRSAERPRLAA
jgi:hypothetical protein